MDTHILEQLRASLTERKNQLEKELGSFAKEDKKLGGDWDTKFPEKTSEGNLEDAADEVERYATSLPIEFSLEVQLKQITKALERMEEGTYGVCKACGKDITPDRLVASPEATLCRSCNEKDRE